MSELINLWDIILKSNTFNFVVLLVIIVIVMQKLHLTEVLENIKNEIIERIEKAKQAKADAENYLAESKLKIENLDSEISEKISLAYTQANNVGDMIRETAQKKIKQVNDNVDKVIFAEEKKISTLLNDRTALASVELAESIIREKLANTPSLHDKYINDSILEIEKTVL